MAGKTIDVVDVLYRSIVDIKYILSGINYVPCTCGYIRIIAAHAHRENKQVMASGRSFDSLKRLNTISVDLRAICG